jgi:gamma-glutamyl-gamma-aminobutyrate hydrolase PuuD
MSARVPLIAISPRLLHQVPSELGFRGKKLQFLEQSVSHWLSHAGAIVAMVPTIERGGALRRADLDVDGIAERFDGLFLQGGADLDPRLYGEEPRPCTIGVDPVRDRFELDLLRAFDRAGKPVLGICRGMQLINIAFGGNLHQDLVLDGVTAESHVINERYDEHGHAITIRAGGRFADWYGEGSRFRINSIHHQAAKVVAPGFVVEAQADDGVVEAIACMDPARFVVGVQWHPEFHDGRDPQLMDRGPLMDAFLAACSR